MGKYIVKRTDGTVIATGESRNVKTFIEELSRNKVDLSNLNAKNLNLNGIVLQPGTRLHAADFTGANLNEATMARCDLSAAIMVRVAANYAVFREAKFTGVNFEDSRAEGINLNRINASKSAFTNVNLAGSTSNGGTYDESSFMDCNFKSCTWRGSSHQAARYVNCDFSEAEFAPSKAPGEKASDLWKGTSVSNCRYTRDTSYPASAVAMREDQFRSKALSGLATATTGMTLGLVATKADELITSHFTGVNSPALAAVEAVAVMMVLPTVHEWAGEYVKDKLTEGGIAIKGALGELLQQGAKLSNLALMAGKARSLQPIKAALLAMRSDGDRLGFFTGIKTLFLKNREILLCDARMLEKASSKISDFLCGNYIPQESITFVNPNLLKDYAAAINISREGKLKAVFVTPESTNVVKFSRNTDTISIRIQDPKKKDWKQYTKPVGYSNELCEMLLKNLISGFNMRIKDHLLNFAGEEVKLGEATELANKISCPVGQKMSPA